MKKNHQEWNIYIWKHSMKPFWKLISFNGEKVLDVDHQITIMIYTLVKEHLFQFFTNSEYMELLLNDKIGESDDNKLK